MAEITAGGAILDMNERDQGLRRPSRRQGLRPQPATRLPAGSHRPERRRQDDGLQPHHGHHPADLGLGRVQRRARGRARALRDHPAGHRAHLPEHQALRQSHRPGQRAHRLPRPFRIQPRRQLRPLEALHREGRRPDGKGPGLPRDIQARGHRGRDRPRTSPTASSAASRSRAPSPATRASSSSTSRRRA